MKTEGAKAPRPITSSAGASVRALRRRLEIEGYLKPASGDAAQRAGADLTAALQAASREVPQLVISDYRLGGWEDGLQAIERLREAAGQMLPALLISSAVAASLAAPLRGESWNERGASQLLNSGSS